MNTSILRTALAASAGLLFIGHAFGQGVPVANPYDQTRTSSFTYRTDGLLETETIEPGSPQLCVSTKYTYDANGNKTGASTADCTGASGRAVFTTRTASSNYRVNQTVVVAGVSVATPLGTFPVTSTNALSQAESKIYDPRFGVATKLTGPNALVTTWQLDDLGRKTRETRADLTSTVFAYCFIAARVTDASSNSANCPSPAAAEVPADAVMFVHSEPHGTADLKNGPFNRVYSDKLGRQIRSVSEAFDGASQPGGASRLVVQDKDYSIYGVPTIVTQPYFLDTASSNSQGAGNYGMTRTDVDALGRPIAIYTTDAANAGNQGGSKTGIAFGNRGIRQAAATTVEYTTFYTFTTNDDGKLKFEATSADSKGVLSIDQIGSVLYRKYDAFGNLILTKDYSYNSVAISYDARGRKVAMNDPDIGLWKYEYNALGELVWQQSPNQRATNKATTMAYDQLGRMTQRIEPEYTSTWSYDKYANGAACLKGVGKLCESKTSNSVSRKFVYDSLGRPISTRLTVTSGPSFASAVSYDSTNGRLASQTYPTGLKVNYAYTPKGFLSQLTLATPATVNPLPAVAGGAAGASISLPVGSLLWQAVAVNARGQAEQQNFGNGVANKAGFDAMTGRLVSATAGKATANDVFSHNYHWDNLGLLDSRTDANGAGDGNAVTDSYSYDDVGRLTANTVSAPAIPSLMRTVTLQYNLLGSIVYKSDVGDYQYGPQGPGQVRPHAVQSVSGVLNASYAFDANGNRTTDSTGKAKSIAYTSFNLPDSQNGIQGANASKTTWLYDENHQRIKEIRVSAGVTRTTWSLHPDNQGGLGFESESTAGGIPSNRHYLSVGGASIGVLVSNAALPTLGSTQTAPPNIASITLNKVEYWHKDHLGSLAATTDHNGAVTARYAYDAFGKRRFANGNADANGNLVIDWTSNTNNGGDRGYTGHEHLDDVGLIHMNRRLFDPMLGVFLQGDPFIQDPGNPQNYNRYAYCYNNPMTCTDPSGLFSLKHFLHGVLLSIVSPIVGNNMMLREVAHSQIGYQIGSIAIGVVSAVYCNGWAAACNGAGQAAWAGFAGHSFSESVRIGVISGLTSQAFTVVGSETTGSMFGNTMGHALVGCASASASGGSCRSGALSAGFSAAVGHMINGYSDDIVIGAMESAMVGGVGSVLGGGKFGNGAVTGAFGYLFNHCAHVQGGCWSALKDAASMTADWATGSGADTRVFGPGSIQVIDMMDAPGVNDARAAFYTKNSAAIAGGSYGSLDPVTNFRAAFGLADLFTNSSPTQQFVGSYRADVWPVNNGSDLLFVLNNNSSFKSFGYGIAPAWERSTFGPAGNMQQTYWWMEPRRP